MLYNKNKRIVSERYPFCLYNNLSDLQILNNHEHIEINAINSSPKCECIDKMPAKILIKIKYSSEHCQISISIKIMYSSF